MLLNSSARISFSPTGLPVLEGRRPLFPFAPLGIPMESGFLSGGRVGNGNLIKG